MIEASDIPLIVVAVAIGITLANGLERVISDLFDRDPVMVCLPIENMPTVVCTEGEERHP